MNLQCYIMTFEEVLRNAQVIDKLDDQRRERLFGLIKWYNNMNKHFDYRLESILQLSDIQTLKEILNTLKQEIREFNAKFNKSFEIIKIIEDIDILDIKKQQSILSLIIEKIDISDFENIKIYYKI